MPTHVTSVPLDLGSSDLSGLRISARSWHRAPLAVGRRRLTPAGTVSNRQAIAALKIPRQRSMPRRASNLRPLTIAAARQIRFGLDQSASAVGRLYAKYSGTAAISRVGRYSALRLLLVRRAGDDAIRFKFIEPVESVLRVLRDVIVHRAGDHEWVAIGREPAVVGETCVDVDDGDAWHRLTMCVIESRPMATATCVTAFGCTTTSSANCVASTHRPHQLAQGVLELRLCSSDARGACARHQREPAGCLIRVRFSGSRSDHRLVAGGRLELPGRG